MRNALFPLFLCVITWAPAFATIRSVNNNPGVQGTHTTIQSAVDASAAGDTIMVEGSPVIYDAVTVAKTLVFIGPGYNNASFNRTNAMLVGTFKLNPGADGSVIAGFTSSSNGWNLEIACPNVRIERNALGLEFVTMGPNGQAQRVNGRVTFAEGSTGALLQDNYLGSLWQTSIPPVNAVVQHNTFLFAGYIWADAVIGSLNGNFVFRNNYFQLLGWATTNNYSGFFGGVSGALFENNIFRILGNNYGNIAATFNNNMFSTASQSVLTGTNNIFSTGPDFVTNLQSNTVFQNDYRLKPGTPGTNAGTDGQDIGVHTASHPFPVTGEVSGVPVVRTISFSNENVPANSSFQVKIVATKAKN